MTATTVEPYKFRRARKGRMLAGVCSGLATASGLDVTVVRICFGLSMLTGLGVIGYILLWIVIPEEQPSRGRLVEPAPENTARVIRVVLLGGALLVLLSRLGIFWPFGSPNGHTTFGFDGVLALILLSVGVGVLVSRYRSDAWSSPQPVKEPTEPTPPPSESASSSFTPWTAPSPTDPADGELEDDDPDPDTVTFVGPLRDVATTVHRDVSAALSSARTDMQKPKRPGGAALGWARVVGWVALLWWMAGMAVLFGLWRFDAVDVTGPWLFFGVCCAVFSIVLNALIRVRKASIVLATLFALLLPIGIAQGMVTPDGPAGSRTLRPVTVASVNNYRQSLGQLELDYSATQFSTAHPTRINARIGTGRIAITLPDNVSVTVVTRIEAGGYDILGKRTEGGVGQRETLRFAGCAGAPHVQIFTRGGAGWIHIQRVNNTTEPYCGTGTPPPAIQTGPEPTTAPEPTIPPEPVVDAA